MANTVKMKRSATPGAVPTTGQLDLGEVAINTYDGKMYIKKDNGTASVVQVGGGSGGGASFAIGTVVQGPTAPTGDGTWLECNGQSVSQTTYASLYSALGHRYLTYKFERGATPSGLSTNNTNFFIYSGTAWLYFTTTNQPQKSTDGGLTWTNTTTMPGSIGTNNRVVTNNAGVVMFHGAQSNAYRTTNDGTSWTTVTLPTANGFTNIGVNGDTWVAISNGSTSMYYSTDAGATWNTRTGVLMAASTLYSRIFWDGTNWVYLTNAATSGMTGRSVLTGTLASGSWSAVTYGGSPWMDAGSGGHIEVIEGSPQLARGGASIYGAQHSGDSGVTTKTFAIGGLSGPLNGGPIWNGLHFVFANSGRGDWATMPQDGSGYYVHQPVPASNSSVGGGLSIYLGAPGGASYVQNGRFDASTNRMVVKMAQFVDGASANSFYACAVYPSVNTSTHFCLPDYVYMDVGKLSTKAWIKAAD